jgi:hypothetical protein
MKAGKIFGFILLFTVLLTLYTVARSRVDVLRADYAYRLHAAAPPFSAEMMIALSGEFKGIAADYLLLEAASFFGSMEKGTPSDWEAVSRLLDQSSSLDPYFKQTYLLAQSILPWYAQKTNEALTILERSKKHLTWDWLPGFFLGFDYHFFLNDNLTASEELMEASKIANLSTSIALSSWASRLASKAGQTIAAIDFLSAVYEKTEDEESKKLLEERIIALRGVEALQSAIDRFQSQFGRMPDTLDELVDTSILSAIPPNPYGRPYTLKDGLVEF